MDWRVRFVDYPEQWRRQREGLLPVIEGTIAHGDLMLRQQLHDFEEHLASFNGSARAVGVSNCTDGLRLLAHALDIGPGDEIVTVAHTFVATMSPFVLRGAKPVLVDIGDDHLMDTSQLASAVTGRTRVIIPVHLNGRTADMAEVRQAADRVGAVVIEDAAQALGAKLDGRTSGTFGWASTYSFYPAKMLGAMGDAGAVLTGDAALADRLLALRDHGRVAKAELDGWGYNCRLDNLQAAILDWRLARLPGWIERRRELARLYTAALEDVAEIQIPVGPDDDPRRYDVYQNYPITCVPRDRLVEHLRGDGIETLISWPIPLHRQKGLGLDHWSLPRTERLCDEVLSLPMQVELTDDQVSYVAESVRRFFGR
ncbi:DegT/DnrJ/EryC1/StrS family aminotransferase [Paractinoplanes atraurantiacus]|uniref:dTDP-4-amino-4,6-dideoxygalactose transaminase n=1 Tax=Paractinoplanes atraurantiacus TaxID=1036182 RepID=A0A285I7R2_9ACTN|nr:DegT/DnrJ/EryC1/StrS family aminotransferase [Actinoplanes atraurantiacus]SNY44008.1 dTDP-4-amino-4,6-dideoxygalactose transaminase [Actinoplanes atraurantiacus]